MKKVILHTALLATVVALTCVSPARCEVIEANDLVTLAEKQTFKPRLALGVNFTPEWQLGGYANGQFSPSYGLSFEAQLSRCSGMELGVFDRLFKNPIPEDNRRHHYVSLRLGYKFYSDILNFGAGLNADIATDNKEFKTHMNRNHYGIYFSISKDIPLCKKLILEPEIHVNPFLSEQPKHGYPTGYEGTMIGLGAKLKFGL